MKQAHIKRPPRATANNAPVLPDMGKLLYKSGKFEINGDFPDIIYTQSTFYYFSLL